MTEKQKKMFGVKGGKSSKRWPKLIYPISANGASFDKFLEPKRIAGRLRKLDNVAHIAEVNTCEEVGLTPANYTDICIWINFRYENNGLAADHWGHTQRIETATRALNAKFKTNLTPFHYSKLLISMRKGKNGPLSTYSFAESKKKIAAS